MSQTYGEFQQDLAMVTLELRSASLRGGARPTEIRSWEAQAERMLAGFTGTWGSYPMPVQGSFVTCSAEEGDFLRKHHEMMIKLIATDALKVPGPGSMNREEFIRRLADIRERLRWLKVNVPPRFVESLSRTGFGSYTEKLEHVEEELRNAGAPTPSPKKDNGCYVATAVYGSYDCPPVWTLRRYRDEHLATTAAGRAFIRAYYRNSPALVDRYRDNRIARRAARVVLDRFVTRLRARGYDDQPYTD